MINWEKAFKDLGVSSDKPVSEATILMAIVVDLYKHSSTQGNHNLRREIETYLTNVFKEINKQN